MKRFITRIQTAWGVAKAAYSPYKWKIVILTALGFLSSFFEGVGVNALIPLFSFVVGTGKGEDVISRAIEKIFSFVGVGFGLQNLLIFIVILFLSKAVVVIIFNYIRIKISAEYEENVRSSLFQKMLYTNWPHLLKEKIGHLQTVLINDVQQSSIVFQRIAAMINLGISLLIYILIALNISYQITLITVVLGAVLLLVFRPIMYRTRMAGRHTMYLNREVSHHINENIIGIKSVKTAYAQDDIAERAKKLFASLKKYRIQINLFQSLSTSLIEPVSVVFISIVFAISFKTLDFNLAVFIAVIYLIQKIFTYIQQFQSNISRLNEGVPFVQSVLEYQKKAEAYREEDEGSNPFVFTGTLSFKNVSFTYDHNGTALSNINFTLRKGELVGLIGPSGGGKTTFVDLVLRLLKPEKGTITLDGVQAGDISLKEWRTYIGYVPQDVFLINGTIAENIRFHDPSITDKEVRVAAGLANISEFIERLPDQYKTTIGERGVRLSVGQRQRIVIARVLARNPTILIFDEATSALDNESERHIQEVIDNLKGTITVLVIAHRLSTIMGADRLVVLDGGKIIEEGIPQKLLEDKDSYFHRVYSV